MNDPRTAERRAQDEPERRQHEEQERLPPEARVREEDLEPFAALRYIARLFKLLAVLLIFLLLAEVVLGLVQAGPAALTNLLVEATRLIVFAGVLWGIGDLALMLIETNHDLRATRILVGRLHNDLERLLASGREPPRGP